MLDLGLELTPKQNHEKTFNEALIRPVVYR